MTLQEFRSRKSNVIAAQKLSRNEVFREVVKVLWEEHPMFMKLEPRIGADKNDSSYQLGVIDGANRIMWLLKNIGAPYRDNVDLKPTFEPPQD